MQKDLRRKRVSDKRQRGCGRSYQAHITPGQGEQQAEEGHRHRRHTQEEIGIRQHPPNHRPYARALHDRVHVAYLLHRPRNQNVTHDREEYDDQNPAPRIEVTHDSAPVDAAEACSGTPLLASFSSSGDLEFASGCCAVNAGPPATNPTPPEMSAIPSQRIGLTCSCSANLATNASNTYPREVAGKTYVRSAHESALM